MRHNGEKKENQALPFWIVALVALCAFFTASQAQENAFPLSSNGYATHTARSALRISLPGKKTSASVDYQHYDFPPVLDGASDALSPLAQLSGTCAPRYASASSFHAKSQCWENALPQRYSPRAPPFIG